MMNQRMTVTLVLAATVLMVTFQNCSKGFKVAENSSLNSAAHEDPHIHPESAAMVAHDDLIFLVHADGLPTGVTYQWSYHFNNMTSGCTVKTPYSSSAFVINCPAAGELVLNASVTNGSDVINLPIYDVMLTTGSVPPPSGIAMLVSFDILAGTGSNAWNTAAAPAEVFIGQTLRLNNLDSVTHQLHTGGKPFAHGSAIAAGASGDEVVTSAYTRAANGAIYDHGLGTSSTFYIVSYDGAALYMQNCSSCHGALATSSKGLARVSDIQSGIANQTQMKTPALMALTVRELEAISYALGAR